MKGSSVVKLNGCNGGSAVDGFMFSDGEDDVPRTTFACRVRGRELHVEGGGGGGGGGGNRSSSGSGTRSTNFQTFKTAFQFMY